MSLGKDYDHFAPQFVEDPFRFWKQLRDEEPVARSEKYGGFYAVTRYEDILEASQDTDRFSSTDGDGIPPLPMVGMIPIDVDPPAHRQYRQVINPALTVNQAAKHEERLRELAVSLIEPLVGKTEFDASLDFAVPFPPDAMLGFIGFPEEEWPKLAKATDDVTRLRGQETDRITEAGMEMVQSAMALVAARKDSERTDDLISLMFEGDFGDRKLEDWEIVQTICVLLFGAVDTTASAIGASIWYLAQNPEAQQRLRTERPINNLTLEELVRFASPIQGLGRTVTQDTELGGCPLHKGDRVLLLWASGNRDERFFTDPDTVDFDRKPNKHLGFGMGPHRCVGVHLGKLMLRIALEEFLDRIPAFELADPDAVKWLGGEARGIRGLPIKLA